MDSTGKGPDAEGRKRLGSTALWVEVREVAFKTLRANGWTTDEADDGAQDTLLKLQEELEKGLVLQNPGAWARVVAYRRAIDRKRRARLAPQRGDDDAAESSEQRRVDPTGSVAQFLAHGQPTSREAMHREQAGRLVDALDERDLQLAWLTAEGLKQSEIAEVLGIGEEGVRKALQRLRKRLRERADELGLDVEVLDHPRPY